MKDPLHSLLSSQAAKIDSSEIRKVFALEAGLKDPINLSIGRPHFPTPPEICESLIQAVHDGKTSYTETQGILPLRERISQKYAEQNGFSVSPEQILISSGTSSLIQLAFMTLIEHGDKILLTDPSFLIYQSMASFFQAKIEWIPENFKREDIEKVDTKNLKMILISHPSNPTGHIYSKEQLLLLAEIAQKNQSILVSDEIYELYDYENCFISPATLYPHTLTLTGFSKSYSMTGLRLAAAAGPSCIIEKMTVLQQYTIVCAPSAVQYAGITALDLNMEKIQQAYKRKRDYCLKVLRGKLNFTHPAGAFYIFAKITGKDKDFVERAVREKNLLLVPGYIFSSSDCHIRISYAAEDGILEKGMKALLELV